MNTKFLAKFSGSIVGVLAVVLTLASCVSTPADEPVAVPLKDRPGVVVFEFIVKSTDSTDIALGVDVAQAITEALLHGARLRPVERVELEKILSEQELSLSGMIRDEDAMRIGRLSGARYILLGSVSVLTDQLRLNARMLDVETAEIVLAESVYGKKSDIFSLESQLAAKIEAGIFLQTE